MRTPFLVLLACLLGLGLVAVEVPAADAGRRDRVTLDRPRTTDRGVVLVGRAPARAKVRIMRRANDGWRPVKSVRSGRHGRYRVVVPRPKRQRWVVRAVGRTGTSAKRVIRPAATPPVLPDLPGDPGEPDLPELPEQPVDPEPEQPETPVDPEPEEPETPVDPEPEAPPADACGERIQKADGTWWDCTFVDEFEGTRFDETKWLAQETWFSGMTNGLNGGCYVKSDDTIEVSAGVVRLSAVKYDQKFLCKSPFGDFMTDRAVSSLTTRGRFSQTYGRFEARVKMDTVRVPGAHAAVWMFPADPKYGKWPLSGEIDIMEWFSALPNAMYPSVHYPDGLLDVHTGMDGVINDPSAYHDVAVEWSPKTMRFYYDDVLVYEHQWTLLSLLLGSQPFDQPFDLILTQVWGGLWNLPTAATPDKVTMTVDRVRVWK